MQIAVVGTILTIGGPVLGAAQSSQTKTDTYTWNGEFVSLDTTAKTMTVKSRVAYQEAISELKHLKAGDRVCTVKPGEWVTVTSRHRPSTDDEAVVAVRPYGARTTTE
jgi:hypothetical protein